MLQRPPSLWSITLMSAAIFCSGGVGSAIAADPTGDWRVADGIANIRVAQCNGSMWGAVSWEQTPGSRDVNNPDVSKKDRPTLGMPILLDMKKKPGVDQWEGQVYNAKDGKLYSSTITPHGTDQLEIQGCVLGFLCGGETWTRVGPPIPPSPVTSQAKGTPKTVGAAKGATTAPKSTGRGQGADQKGADQIGDICLLGDIARLAH
jgi:uncharacterized protein (DUF2147 family)